jgi:M6 family metalloprotease-like protein
MHVQRLAGDRRALAVLMAVGVAVVWPVPVRAQGDVEELGRALGGARPPAAYYELRARNPRAFEFSETNGWIRRGRALAARRNGARSAAGALAEAGLLLAPEANIGGGVMRGSLNVPVFLALYANTDSTLVVTHLPQSVMAARLYGTDAAPPYSIHTYYRELSNDSLQVNGTVFDWTRVSGLDTYYEAACNGLCASAPIAELIRELVQSEDAAVDFGQFDNDGPDGIPNSGDDDGVVDAIVIMHPEVDGACKNSNPASVSNVWAHRWSYAARTGSMLATNDASNAAPGGFIKVNDYIIQGGQGGDGGCTDWQPQAMGVVAHETGHLLGLPDLYDVNGSTAGIGFWGLMGSGNWNVASRPAHMSAWSRAELGWITEVLIPTDTTLDLGPIETADTAYVVPIGGTTEYFLLENRQRLGSDSALKAPGLLIWHVDSALVAQRWFSNNLNGAMPHGVALHQADGLNQMDQGSTSPYRGDDGDPYPGSTGNHTFASGTNPSSARNDGTPTYIAFDQIGQQAGSPRMVARIAVRYPSLVRASDPHAAFYLDQVSRTEFRDVLEPGTIHELDIDSVQVADGGRYRFTWLAWSDGQPKQHTFVSSAMGDTIVANVASEYVVAVDVIGTGGTVSAIPAVDLLAGTFLAPGTPVTLAATVTQPGILFEGWSGDTTASGDTLRLAMDRPYRVSALFAASLAIVSAALPQAVMGAAYTHGFAANGGIPDKTWSLAGGSLPEGLTMWGDGTLSGTPKVTGSFAFTVRVVSGSQTVTSGVQLEVGAPALVAENVVGHLTGASHTLSTDEITYLDLVGNANGRLDVGDFLAWVETTGGAVSAEMMQRVLRAGTEVKP